MRENNPINNANSTPSPESAGATRLFPFRSFWVLAFFLLGVLTIRIAPPDLAFYYSFTHSLIFDADFCFANEYSHFPFAHHELYLSTQRLPANDWPMGTGLCWIPFLLLAQAVRFVASLVGISSSADGYGWFDRWTVTFGAALLYGGGTLWASWRYCLANGLSKNAARWALGLIAFGSSFSYHLFVNAADSHPPSAFFIILFLLTWQINRAAPSWRGALLTGFSIGLAGLIRPHNLVFLLTPLLDWLFDRDLRKRVHFFAPFTLLIGGAFLAFCPQLIVWKTLYGAWLMVPRSSDVFWTQPELYQTLFSDFHGMISWSPLFGIGLIGLFIARKHLPAAIPVVVLIYIYSCNIAWWCGGSFGNRRMVSVAPLFILGLAILFDAMPKVWFKIIAALFGLWTLSLLLAEAGGAIQLDHYQPWQEILNAIQAGWRPGFIRLFTGADWGAHILARLAGFVSILITLGAGYFIITYIANFRKKWITPAATGAILGLIAFCAFASQRTALAAKDADLSRYVPYDRFTWVVYYEKGFYQIGQKDFFGAVETFTAAAILEPRHSEPWMYLAYLCSDIFKWKDYAYHFSSLALEYGKRTEAFFQFFDKLLSDRIESGAQSLDSAYNQRGVIRGLRKYYLEAEADFRKALSINSNYLPAAKNLEILETWKKGNKEPFKWE